MCQQKLFPRQARGEISFDTFPLLIIQFMKYIIFTICLLSVISISAQKINKDYLFFPQESGNLYFIYPQKGFTSQNKTDIKGLEYDITYLATDDSLTFSYIYINKEICKPETISFHSSDNKVLYQGKAQMLFVQPIKQNWKHRGTVKVPYAKAVEFFSQSSSIQLQFHTNKQELHYQMNDSKWKKQCYLINRIFEIIANNN